MHAIPKIICYWPTPELQSEICLSIHVILKAFLDSLESW